jgi:hypothetical protein
MRSHSRSDVDIWRTRTAACIDARLASSVVASSRRKEEKEKEGRTPMKTPPGASMLWTCCRKTGTCCFENTWITRLAHSTVTLPTRLPSSPAGETKAGSRKLPKAACMLLIFSASMKSALPVSLRGQQRGR